MVEGNERPDDRAYLEVVLVKVFKAESLGPELEVVGPPVVDADEGDLCGRPQAELLPRPLGGLGQRDLGVTFELRPEAEGVQTLLPVLLVELSPALKDEGVTPGRMFEWLHET